jgi:hypothetical protein
MVKCSIYATGHISEVDLTSELGSFLNAKANAISCIDKVDYQLYIEGNDEFNEHKQKEFPDGFLFFKYLIYIEFKEGVTQEFYVEETARILNWLWHRNIAAVAASDYESLLPENGGYKSHNVPWAI